MKRIMKIFTALGAVSFVLGFIIGLCEEKNGKCHYYGFYEKYFKRSLDFSLALLALIVFSPILIGVALLVRVKLGTPVIFMQERPGRNEKIFRLYKFRSMSNAADEEGNLLPDEQRLTNFGLLLRKTSLDELPELVNIVKGDMAIVGPRPLMVNYLPYYSQKEKRRHEVRPGLTGLAQVHGRNTINWEERFEMDVKYVDNITCAGDIKILFDTIHAVISGKDIETNALEDFDVYRKKQCKKD